MKFLLLPVLLLLTAKSSTKICPVQAVCEIYRQAIYNELNYIKIEQKNGLTNGVFYGAEVLPDSSYIYYKSAIDGFQIKDKAISFVLKKFEFSSQPFSLEDSSHAAAWEKPIPLSFPPRIQYVGKKEKNQLNLFRVLDRYDSWSDDVVFIKVK